MAPYQAISRYRVLDHIRYFNSRSSVRDNLINIIVALDVLRLMVLHPHAADHYAVAHAKDQDDNLVDIVISYLLEDVVVVPNLIMTWRYTI
jgi:hypothetical protein